MLRKFFYFTLFLVAASPLAAQEEDWITKLASAEFKAKKVIPPTPEPASLGKYGNVPVSLFSGTPNISVPLYQLSGHSLNLPVQLTYNAGGFNPQEIAGWTGLGWSLNAGGVVTRSVMGNPDDISNYFISPSPLVMPSQTTDPYGYYDYMENLRKGIIEAQPDMYYYNFAGHTGKFLLKPDNSVLKKEKNNYIITAITGTTTGSNVVIIDEQGTRFEFMEFESSFMQTDDISTDVPIRSYTYPSTWYLTRIQSADGFEEITFSYHTTALEHNQFNNFYQTESAVYQETISYTGGGSSFYGPETKAYQPHTVKTRRKYLQQIVLKRAGATLAYIDFISAADQRQDLDHNTYSGFPGERLLNSIKVYTKKNGTVFSLTKQFDLNYSYFTNSGNAGWDHKRLRLDNVLEVPVVAGIATPPPYAFTYNNDNLMPGLNSTAMDHWGFYNLGNGTGTLVPNNSIVNGNINITAENRKPTLAGSSSYLINKLTYATGGYTMFEYELNKAREYIGSTTTFDVGGVRIKRITDYSFTGKKAQEKTYDYLMADAVSSGLAIVPQYLSSSNYQSLGTIPGGGGWQNPCNEDLLTVKNTYSIAANSIIGLGVFGGGTIGYERVTESVSDPANNQPLGKTVYEYSVDGAWDIHDNYGNGELIKKSVHDNGGKLIQEVSSTYNFVLNGSIGAVSPGVSAPQNNRSVLVKTNNPAGGYFYGWYMAAVCATGVIESRIYKNKFVNAGWAISSREKQLTQQTVKQYDQLSNSYLTITKNFTYGNTAYTLPTKITQTTTNSEQVVTETKYPLDYTIPTSGTMDNNTTGMKLQKDKNIIAAAVESIQYRQNPDGSNKRYVTGTLTTYNPSIPFPEKIYRLELSAPLSSFTLSSVSGGNFSYNSNYKPAGSFIFNSNGTLLQQRKEQDIASAYVWDHDYQYATAEVVNAETGQIAYTSFEGDGTGEWTTISNIGTNRLSGGVTGKYSYLLAGNTITKTGLPSSRQYIVSYWSLNGSIVATTNTGTGAPVIGPVHNGWTYYYHLLPLNSTSLTLTGDGKTIDELRLYPKDAYMTTVTYDPGVGAISQNSPNNKIGYFEYDGLNRLINAKDEDANIIKNFKYNFGSDLSSVTASAQSLFYNVQKQGNYTKQGCPSGGEGTTVTYIVPYGKYAALAQTDADNMAQTDVNNNGQAWANANGQCLFWNTQQADWFTKDDCTYEQGPPSCPPNGNSQIQYIIAAHTYSSLVNLATANSLAWSAVQNGGQAYANSNCQCSCVNEGYKYINGNCELGTRYNSSTTYMGNGIWECTYYYEWSDYTYSQFYTEYNSSPCPIY